MKPLKICIDPGHGMSNRTPGVYDPGAVNPITKAEESDIVFAWAVTLKTVLFDAGIPFYMTRVDEGSEAPLINRVRQAQLEGCTHFVSLHCNAGSRTASGSEVYWRDDNDGADDKQFALMCLSAITKATGLPNRGLRSEKHTMHKRLAVLGFKGAACLIELGFIDKDIRTLHSREARIKFANEFIKGLNDLR